VVLWGRFFDIFYKKVTILWRTYPQNYFSWKSQYMKKLSKKSSFFLNFGGIKSIIFFKFRGDQNYHFLKNCENHFFRKYVCMSQNGHFFTKNVEKCSPKIMKIRFCYGKTLFANCDKVAELTFFGADFRLLWSTLCP
jgi:hypothetical protein